MAGTPRIIDESRASRVDDRSGVGYVETPSRISNMMYSAGGGAIAGAPYLYQDPVIFAENASHANHIMNQSQSINLNMEMVANSSIMGASSMKNTFAGDIRGGPPRMQKLQSDQLAIK